MTDETSVPRASLPVEITKFWANRRGEAVITALREYEGRPLLDVRRYYSGKDGKLHPTKKGIAIAVGKLPELAAAINAAVAKARELGLLKIEGAE